MALLSDEGGIFGQMLGRYSQMSNLDIYLKGHAGGELIIDRRGRHERIPEVHLTLGLAVQPDVLRSLGEHAELRGKGLQARFLFAMPPARVGERDFVAASPVPEDVKDRYCSTIETLVRNLSPGAFGFQADETMTFDDEATRLFQEFQRRSEHDLRPGGTLTGCEDWGNKLPGHVARIAALIHLVAQVQGKWGSPITADEMRAAIEIGDYLIPHARAVFALMHEGDDAALARRILELVRRRKMTEFTARDAHRALASVVAKASDLRAPLELLVDRGWLREEELPRSPKGGRPSVKFTPHPCLLAAPTTPFPTPSVDPVDDDLAGTTPLEMERPANPLKLGPDWYKTSPSRDDDVQLPV